MQNQDVQERMFQFIKTWQQSGVSQKIFCEQNGIRYHVFHYWFKKFRDAGSDSTDAGFIPLEIKSFSFPETVPYIEFVQADGSRVLFHQPVSADFIKAIIN